MKPSKYIYFVPIFYQKLFNSSIFTTMKDVKEYIKDCELTPSEYKIVKYKLETPND